MRMVRRVVLVGIALLAIQALGVKIIGSPVEDWFSLTLQIVGELFGTLVVIIVAVRSRSFLRLAWILVAASSLMVCCFNLATFFEQTRGFTVFPSSVSDVLMWFYAFPLALLIFVPDRGPAGIVGPATSLDFAQVVLLISSLYFYAFYLLPHTHVPGLSLLHEQSILKDTRNTALAIGFLARMFWDPSPRARKFFQLLSIPAVLYAAANGLFLHQLEAGVQRMFWYEMFWTALPVMYAAAAVYSPRIEEAAPSERTLGATSNVMQSLALAAPLLVLLLSASIDRERPILGVALVLVSFGLLTARLFYTQKRQEAYAQRLRESEEWFQRLFEEGPLPAWVIDADDLRILEVNQSAIEHYGYTREEFRSLSAASMRPPEDVPTWLETMRLPNQPSRRFRERRHRKKNGTIIDVEIAAQEISFRGRRAWLSTIHDITERRRMEERLRQSQKLEAVGTLAGGVAHDFNNLLTVIKGYTSLLISSEGTAPFRRELQEIENSANRATALTRQLLAFSRQQMVEPRVLELNAVLVGMESMLQRLLGENLELVTSLQPDLGRVKADANQLEQVVMNLAINARDAMPKGGRLVLETSSSFVNAEQAREMEIPTGKYVVLTAQDSGFGIPANILPRIFEPFFTTKEVGKGTGLGLSTVYGIVRQHGGAITVQSEAGAGSIFKVFLPRIEEPMTAGLSGSPGADATRNGKESLLLVEDDDALRHLCADVLAKQGYHVMEADRSEKAERIARDYSGEIQLLVTDLVLPGGSGTQLAEVLKRDRPSLKILFMSGYSGPPSAEKNFAGSQFLQKPFTAEALMQRVRETLDARAAHA